MAHKRTVAIVVAAILLSGCASGIAGRYRANFSERAFLKFGPQHQVALQDGDTAYRGRYSTHGDHVTIVLEQPYTNGQREQTFKVEDDTLTAVEGALFLPGGTKFVRVR